MQTVEQGQPIDLALDDFEQAFRLTYDELRQLASLYLRRERPSHTFQTTELLHEAYLRLSSSLPASFNDRRHFFATAALAMRRILVDYARRKTTEKRTQPDPASDEARDALHPPGALTHEELIDLDHALTELEAIDPRQSQIVHLRVFAGLTGAETAEMMAISERTMAREWFAAKAWLKKQITSP